MTQGAAGRAGSVIWITGLSGAGKTTLAKAVTIRLRAMGEAAALLDGDDLRVILSDEGEARGYGREARLALAFRYARLCQLLAGQGLIVVIATISLFHEVHCWNRQNLPNYREIYLPVPLAELRARDPRGLYRRFDAGEIAAVAGLDVAVDEPLDPHCVLQPGQDPLSQVEQVLRLLPAPPSGCDVAGVA